jgi:hypothetical protein
MAVTPDEWLRILAGRLDLATPRYARLRAYANGEAPLPEMGKNVQASWTAFQKKARTNYGGLCIDSLANRLVVNGVRIGEASVSDALTTAQRVLRDNRWDVQVSDAVRDYLITATGYMLVSSEGGRAVITREMPEMSMAAVDPLRPWKARAFLKVWRDIDAGRDFAFVWVPGARQKYSRNSYGLTGDIVSFIAGGWTAVGELEEFDGDVPVVVFTRPDGIGLFEPHTDVIDRINLGKLQRLVITAMQAFRQRATKGGLPQEDEDGNSIDYSKIFEPAPGALWDLPEGIDIWESEQTDIRPMLEGEKADARDFAAVTRTPISVFIPEGANQSAEGAASAKEGQVFQAKDEISRLTVGLAVAIVYALRVEGVELGSDTVSVLWEPPEHVSMAEKFAAAAQAKAAGLSLRTIQRTILGMGPDEIALEEADRADELLASFALTGNGNPVA